MVKNINTELTYRIFLQVIPGNAAQSQDYDTSVRPNAVLDFPPNQQRLQVFGQLLSFEVLPDVLLEGEESVKISSEPVSTPGPAYTRPLTGAVTTIFILDDDDSKK